MDAPLQRTLKIDKVSVGLIGLDVALNKIRNNPCLVLGEAVNQVFAEVEAKNYIPSSAVEAYRTAIAKEISRLRGDGGQPDEDLVIRILGPGCVSCNNLQKMVIEIMAATGIAVDVFQVHEMDEIGRFGVMQTPALVVNGKVKCAGRLSSRAQVEDWLREELP